MKVRGARLAGTAVLSMVLAGCGGSEGVSVTYRAEGSAGTAEVTYSTDEGSQTDTVDLPWTLTIEVGSEFDGELVVTNPTDEGGVACSYAVAGFSPATAAGELSATCGGYFVVSGSSANGSFYSEFEDRPVDPDAPQVAEVSLGTPDGETTTFSPFDPVTVVIDLRQLTEEVVLDVEAEALPLRLGTGKSLSAATLLREGEEFEGGVYVASEGLSPPSDGWQEGSYTLELAITLTDGTERYEPVSETYALEFIVAIPEVTSGTYERGDGRFSFEYPSDWVTEEWVEVSGSAVTNDQLGEPRFEANAESLDELQELAPRDPSLNGDLSVFIERARFTAPELPEWVDAQVAGYEERGLTVIDREDTSMGHGPAVRVVGESVDDHAILLFTASADRLYLIEYLVSKTVADELAPAADAILDSFVFHPENEPVATPLDEARDVPLTLTHSDGREAAVRLHLPADWTVFDDVEETGTGRFLVRGQGPDPSDGTMPDELLLHLELLVESATVEAYADFYLAEAESRLGDDFELLERATTTAQDDTTVVRATWTAQGIVVDEAYLVSEGFAMRPSFEVEASRFDPALLDAVLPTMELTLLP